MAIIFSQPDCIQITTKIIIIIIIIIAFEKALENAEVLHNFICS